MNDEEVDVQHFSHELIGRGWAAFQLLAQLVVEATLAYVWAIQKSLSQLAKQLRCPDARARRKQRVIFTQSGVNPLLSGGVHVLRPRARSSG